MFLKLYRYEELTQSFAEKEQGRFQQIYLNLSKYEVKTSANLKHQKLFSYLAMNYYLLFINSLFTSSLTIETLRIKFVNFTQYSIYILW